MNNDVDLAKLIEVTAAGVSAITGIFSVVVKYFENIEAPKKRVLITCSITLFLISICIAVAAYSFLARQFDPKETANNPISREDSKIVSDSEIPDGSNSDFVIEAQVRLADSEDKSWHKSVDAKVGDKVEFLIGYYNNSQFTQGEVAIRDYLPKNLKYIDGSTVLRNSNHISGVTMNSNKITDGGIWIGSYGAGANAYVTFTAEVVDNSLAYGKNSLINYAQGGVGDTVIEDSATVRVVYEDKN